jgi:hypothetical protein
VAAVVPGRRGDARARRCAAKLERSGPDRREQQGYIGPGAKDILDALEGAAGSSPSVCFSNSREYLL